MKDKKTRKGKQEMNGKARIKEGMKRMKEDMKWMKEEIKWINDWNMSFKIIKRRFG